MTKEQAQQVLDELQGVRPEMLNKEAKRLFEATMKIADNRDEIYEKYYKLKAENEELKKLITEGITIEPNSPYQNYQLDFLRENFVPAKKIKDILNEINEERRKQEKISDKYFKKENRDMQEYYIQKEVTSIMQELGWVEEKIQELLKGENSESI